jgi:hypothetical protein
MYKDLISSELFEVVVALASLAKDCYSGKINQDSMQAHADSVHASALNFISKINILPLELKAKLTGRLKIHLLYHICIRRFGPPHLFCTEKEESFNQETRTVNSTSNRHAYSLHTAERFCDY